MKRTKLLLPLLALLLTLVLVGCFEGNVTTKAYSYVVLDINPSVEMVLDENNEVEYVNALNDDADLLLADLELEGLPAEEAVDAIIEESTEIGFIDPEAEETVVDVTVVTEAEGEEEVLEETIVEDVNEAFTKRGMRGIGQLKEMTAEIIAEAESLGIGAGRLRLIKHAQELNPDLTLEAALELNPRDIMRMVMEKGNEVRNMTHDLRDQFFTQRDQIRAEYQDQIDALRLEISELNAQIEAELDEEAKAVLETNLATLEASLEAIITECNQKIAESRDQFLADAQAAMEQIREECRSRIEANRGRIDQFRENFEANQDSIMEDIENWMHERMGGRGRN